MKIEQVSPSELRAAAESMGWANCVDIETTNLAVVDAIYHQRSTDLQASLREMEKYT